MGSCFEGKELLGYIISQVLGDITAAAALFLIASGNLLLACNQWVITATLVTEVVMTFS